MELAEAMLAAFLNVAVDDLNTAITLLLEGTESEPKDVSAHSRCLFEASTALKIRFYMRADPQDLQMAIELLGNGLSLSPDQRSGLNEARCAVLLENFVWLEYHERDPLRLALQAYDDLFGLDNKKETVR